MTTPQLYIPPTAVEIKKYPSTPMRLMLIGLPGTGKTFSALTFPNPIVADMDNKLNGYVKFNPEKSFHALPFWNMEFCAKTCNCTNAGPGKNNNPQYPANGRDAFKYWLREEGSKLKPEQTFILDSWTSMQSSFDLQSKLPHEIVYSNKTAQEDGFAFWGRKKQYSKEIVNALNGLSCGVVVICHETYERNDNGTIVGLKPLQDGSYADELPSCFTDLYRQRVFNKKEALERKLAQVEDTCYWWHTNKDETFKIACKSIPSLSEYVRAEYKSLVTT